MARSSDPLTHALWSSGATFGDYVRGARADDSAVRELDAAVQTAEELGDDNALGLAKYILGIALVSRDGAADHQRGLELLKQVRDMWLGAVLPEELPVLEFTPRARGSGAATAMVPYR